MSKRPDLESDLWLSRRRPSSPEDGHAPVDLLKPYLPPKKPSAPSRLRLPSPPGSACRRSERFGFIRMPDAVSIATTLPTKDTNSGC